MPDRDLTQLIVATQAQITRATSAEQLTSLAAARGDATIFDTNAPFFWGNEISSNRLDSYYTRMDPLTTLPNFAADAATGVAFLAGHRQWELPFGATLTGTVETTGDVTRVLADAYTLSGLDIGGVKVDSFISGVRAGIIRDVSVGFHGGQWICDICGRDMAMDWECWHIPGFLYEVQDSSGSIPVVREILAAATIKNAHLSEVSAVYDGATPGAAILLAERAAEAGRLTTAQARIIEQRYRINLPGKRLVVPGATLQETPNVENEQEQPVEQAVATEEVTAELVGGNGEPVEVPAAIAAEEITDRVRGVSDIQGTMAPGILLDRYADLRGVLGIGDDADVVATVRALMLDAEAGRAYRSQQIDAAIAEGVRAIGATFDEATYRAMLSGLPVTSIQRMRDDWASLASVRFPGGRVSQDGAQPAAQPQQPAPQIPNAAFAG